MELAGKIKARSEYRVKSLPTARRPENIEGCLDGRNIWSEGLLILTPVLFGRAANPQHLATAEETPLVIDL
jgi:hypothetical protein